MPLVHTFTDIIHVTDPHTALKIVNSGDAISLNEHTAQVAAITFWGIV